MENYLRSEFNDLNQIKLFFLKKASWRVPLLFAIKYLLATQGEVPASHKKYLNNIVYYTDEILQKLSNLRDELGITLADEYLIAYTIAVLLAYYNDIHTLNVVKRFKDYLKKKLEEIVQKGRMDTIRPSESRKGLAVQLIQEERYITLGLLLYDVINILKILKMYSIININQELLEQIIRNMIDVLLESIEIRGTTAKVTFRRGNVEYIFESLKGTNRSDMELYATSIILMTLSSYYPLLLKDYNILPSFVERYYAWCNRMKKIMKSLQFDTLPYFPKLTRQKILFLMFVTFVTSIVGYIEFQDIKSIYFGILIQILFYLVDKVSYETETS